MEKPEGKPAQPIDSAQIARLMAQSGCLVLVLILVSLAGGIWLDRTLNTRPLFILLLVLGSVPIGMFVLFRLAMGAVAGSRASAQVRKETSNHDDDTD